MQLFNLLAGGRTNVAFWPFASFRVRATITALSGNTGHHQMAGRTGGSVENDPELKPLLLRMPASRH
jgi:hypothetical protein